jgi:hypothetical protein
MLTMIPTYALYGLDAIPTEVIVGENRVRVVEPKSSRTLCELKQEPSSSTPAGVQSGGPNLVRRKPAPETMKTRQPSLYYPLSPI